MQTAVMNASRSKMAMRPAQGVRCKIVASATPRPSGPSRVESATRSVALGLAGCMATAALLMPSPASALDLASLFRGTPASQVASKAKEDIPKIEDAKAKQPYDVVAQAAQDVQDTINNQIPTTEAKSKLGVVSEQEAEGLQSQIAQAKTLLQNPPQRQQ